MNIAQAKAKINELVDPRLKPVGHLLLDLGIELIACGDETKIKRDKKEIGQIDLILRDKELKIIFLVEVSTLASHRSKKISHFFSRWEDEDYLQLMREQFSISSAYKIHRIFFELTGKNQLSESVKHHLKRKDNHILNEYDFRYFKDAFNKVQRWAKNDFFSYLDLKPPYPTNFTLPAIQFYLGSTRAYAYVDNVARLLKYCYIFRRRKNDKGYQRVLEKGRIGSITKKIRSGSLLAFPNTILIRCPEDLNLCASPKDPCDCPAPVNINVPSHFSACRVIDGQHRLLGFANLEEEYQENHSLSVIVLEAITQQDEIKTFIEINSTQKKIDRNLILALAADFEWSKENNRKEFFEKIAVEVVKRLNEKSPLKGKIFIPEALEKKKGKITLATLVSAIIGNNFIGGGIQLFQKRDNDIDTPYEEIKNIFSLIQQYLPKYSSSVDSFFLSNKGLRTLFRLIQIYERNKMKERIKFAREDLIKDLQDIFNNRLIETLEDYYGEGGANRAVEEIVKLLKKNKKRKYAKMKTKLKKIKEIKRT